MEVFSKRYHSQVYSKVKRPPATSGNEMILESDAGNIAATDTKDIPNGQQVLGEGVTSIGSYDSIGDMLKQIE